MVSGKVRRSHKSLTGIPEGDNTENGGEAVLKERHQSSDSGAITIPQFFLCHIRVGGWLFLLQCLLNMSAG